MNNFKTSQLIIRSVTLLYTTTIYANEETTFEFKNKNRKIEKKSLIAIYVYNCRYSNLI